MGLLEVGLRHLKHVSPMISMLCPHEAGRCKSYFRQVDIKGLEKASSRLSQAMEASRQARNAAATAWESLLDIEARSEECQAQLTIVMEGLGGPLKESQAACKRGEKEKKQADKVLAKVPAACRWCWQS